MSREKFSCLSWSCFAQASMAVLIILALAGSARADTVKDFVVKGTLENVSGETLGSCVARGAGSFSGTMVVDVTSRSLETVEIFLPGLFTFDTRVPGSSHPRRPNHWSFNTKNVEDQRLILNFTTTHVLASLVNFDGGSMVGFEVRLASVGGGGRGFLTQSSAAPLPECMNRRRWHCWALGLSAWARW